MKSVTFGETKNLILDAHFHPLSCLTADLNVDNDSQQNLQIQGVGASTCPQEWEALRQWSVCRNQPFVLGIHPWLAETLATDLQGETKLSIYLTNLDNLLNLNPRPCAIGEIGFDKVHNKQPNFLWQKKLFAAQYKLARKYSLPIVIHCVKAYNYLFDSLSELSLQFKQPLLKGLIHAFWASPELAMRLVKLDFYISLNSKLIIKAAASEISSERSKLISLAKIIPLHRLLLESDAPWGTKCSDDILKYCSFLAPYWSVETVQLQEICQNNLRLFYE